MSGVDLLALAEREIQPDDWVVVRRRYGWSSYLDHERAQVQNVKPKTLYVKLGAGRRLTRVSRDDVILVESEEAAKLLCDRTESAKAEAQKREFAARDAYKAKLGKLYSAALRARHQSAAGEGENG